MTAPSLRQLGAVLSTSTASPSFAAPAGAVSTDVIVILWFQDDARTTVSAAPSGFTAMTDLRQVNDPALGSPSHSLYGYWGRFSAVGAGPYGFTITGGTPFIEGRSGAVQDCITSGNPFEAADGNTSGNTDVTTAPSCSATSLGTDRYAIYAATNWASGAWTPPSGFTEEWDANTRILTIDDKTLATAQTVTPQAVCASSSRSNAWVGILLPVAGGSSVTADAALAVTATLAAAASAARPGSGALAVTASLAAAATGTRPADAALAATATIAATVVRTALPAAALAVTAVLSATDARTAVGSASLAVTVTLAASGVALRPAAAALAVVASIVAAAANVSENFSSPNPQLVSASTARTLTATNWPRSQVSSNGGGAS